MKEGKKFIVLITLFTATVLNSAFGQTIYQYSIKLSEQFRNKDIMALTLDPLVSMNRRIVSDGFSFASTEAYSQNFLTQHFANFGIPVSGFDSQKTEAVSLAEEKAGNNCGVAQLLCSNASLSAGSSGPGTQELGGGNQGCLGVEHQSSWYYLNVQTGGTLTFIINPSASADDYDFAVWGPFTAANAAANCPPTSAPIRCSYSAATGSTGLMIPISGQTSSFGCGFFGLGPCTGLITTTNNPVDNSEGAGGDKWVQNLAVSANQIYIVLVDNFSSSGNTYNMVFGGTAGLGCTPVVLPVELSGFTGTKYNGQNILRWTTESESNTKDFSVEWSSDPLSGDWQSIGKLDAQIFSQSQNHYSLVHASPDSRKINYYRLVQRDQDGYEHIYNDKMIAIDNSDPRKIDRIIDLMGREASEFTPGIVIYQYNDGSTEKVFQ